jgi:hypothetical protein
MKPSWNLKELSYLSNAELLDLCLCKDSDEFMCQACFVRGALDAGIPPKVIAGEDRLSDYFSREYIEHKANKHERALISDTEKDQP